MTVGTAVCPGCGAARAHIQRMHRPPKFGVMWDALSIEQLSAAEREAKAKELELRAFKLEESSLRLCRGGRGPRVMPPGTWTGRVGVHSLLLTHPCASTKRCCKNIRLSSDVANHLSRSRNFQAVGDTCLKVSDHRMGSQRGCRTGQAPPSHARSNYRIRLSSDVANHLSRS